MKTEPKSRNGARSASKGGADREISMVKRVLRAIGSGIGLLGFVCALLGGVRGAGGQTVTSVPALDINRLTGTWYEVARLPNKREKKCVSDVFSLIAPGDKAYQFTVVTSCKQKNGFTDARNANGKRQDKKGVDGRLKVTFLWPFSYKFWVLALGPEYEWTLVGSPNHKELTVLSRTAVMKPEALAEAEGKASAQGFAVTKLVMTPQGLK